MKARCFICPTICQSPPAPGYQNAVEQTLISMARALKGRTLALFTSYAQLRRTEQAIKPALTEAHVSSSARAADVTASTARDILRPGPTPFSWAHVASGRV